MPVTQLSIAAPVFETLMPDVLEERRRGFSPTWRQALLSQVHTSALLEDMARRGGPRSAQQWSERDWLSEELIPAMIDAALVGRAAHRALHPPARPIAPRIRRSSLATYYAACAQPVADPFA